MLKKVLEIGLNLIMKLWPKSRWGNLVYLILGFALSNYDVLKKLVEEIGKLFS